MAIAYDAVAIPALALYTATFSWTHTPVGTPKGVAAIVVQERSTDQVSGVTYGGVSMTRVRTDVRTATEPGRVYIYFLGASIPTGAQTVQVTLTGTADTNAVSLTVTAASDTSVDTSNGLDAGIIANPSLSISPTVAAVIFYGIFSGLAAPVTTVEAGSTHVAGKDYGTDSAMWARKSVASGGATTIGYTAASDDVCHSALAIREGTGLTAVGDTVQKIWNIRQVVPDTSQFIYNVKALVSDTSQSIWNLRYALGDTSQYVWNIRTRIAGGVTATWLGTWAKRINLTIDHTDIDSALTDFPILIYISASFGRKGEDISCVFDELTSDANRKKIAVTTSDGTTECYVEIEKWDDANEKAWLWVKVPSISDTVDTDLYLYYDSTHADNTNYVGDTNDAIAENVWDANFLGVWHMADGADTSHIYDSTGNDVDGTKKGAAEPAVTTSGIMNNAQNFAGDDDYINLGTGLNITDGTWELWAKFDVVNVLQIPLAKDTSGGRAYDTYMGYPTASKIGATIFSAASDTSIGGGTTLLINTPYYIVWSYDYVTNGTSKLNLYLNGATDATQITNAVGPPASQTTECHIGDRAYTTSRCYTDGIIDEVRISDIVRSAAWIKATYETGRDDLLALGASQYRWNVRKAIGQARQTIWHTLATVGDTSQYIWNVLAGVTAVGDVVQLVWHARQAVSDTIQKIWNIRQAIGDTVQHIWNIRTAVGDTIQHIWNVTTSIGDTVQKIWNVRTAVADTSQYVWHARQAIAQTRQTIWNVFTPIADTLQTIWHYRQAIGQTRQAIWNAIVSIGDTIQSVWHTRFALGKPIQLIHNVLTAIGDTTQYIWNVLAGVTAVGDVVQFIWHIKSSVGDTIQKVWNVRALATKTSGFVYHIRALASDTIQSIWNIRQAINKAVQPIWNIRLALGKTRQLIWYVLIPVSDTSQAVWKVLTSIGDTSQFLYNLRYALGKATSPIWNVRATLAKTRQLIWYVLTPVSDTLQSVWNIRYVVGKANQFLYNLRFALGDALQSVWNIKAILGKTRQLVWYVLTPISDTTQAVWNIRKLAGQTTQFIYRLRKAITDTLQTIWKARTQVRHIVFEDIPDTLQFNTIYDSLLCTDITDSLVFTNTIDSLTFEDIEDSLVFTEVKKW